MRKDTGQIFRIEDYRPTPYAIEKVDLLFQLDPQATMVTARLAMRARAGTNPGTALVLDGDELTLISVKLDGAELEPSRYQVDSQRLELSNLPTGERFDLEIVTRIDPSANSTLMGLYRSRDVYCTQCEAEGFRRITYFLDRPDVLTVYTVRIEADQTSAPVLLSNGNLVESGELGGGRHFAVWHDPHPKPSYLFALVAGSLGLLRDSFVTASGRTVDLGIYVEHGKEARAAYAMDALKRSMRWDEEVFGLEYDLDIFNIVAVSDFNMGAMENKGLNIFNDKYILADPDTATDTDYANIEAIVAHEYFHNWTGNRITCRDWFQLCLKEGLTVFRDHEFSADERSRAVKRIAEVRALRAHQFPEDQGPLAHPVRPRRYREINNFYTATVYEKGSEVVRMIRTVLGQDDFDKGMRLYLDRHDGDAATIEDFIKAFEDASGKDLGQFALWYHQAGTPHLTVNAVHDAAARELRLEIEQSVPPTPSEARKRLMHIPLIVGLVGAQGTDMEASAIEGAEVVDGVIHIKKRKHVVRFKGISERPRISLNRGFSAPVTISMERDDDDLTFLARHDRDPFARWEALNALLTDAVKDAARQIRAQRQPAFEADLLSLVGELAMREDLEPAFRALALTLPSEADIAREMGSNIDPDAIHAARDMLSCQIGLANLEAFTGLYEAHSDGGAPFSPDAVSAGRRALRNALLEHLSAATGDPSLAARQFAAATNMTDLAAALMQLAHRFPQAVETLEALGTFEARFAGDPLVMDKWFAIQASTPGAGGVERVRDLMRHPGFALTNPNRVRSLVGTFATANQTGFHRADGAGYDFFAATVVEIDARNPQLAARLATAFRSWKALEPDRQKAARAALSGIARNANLSTDLRDIVERTLA
jgi:aminopeptidase N